MKAVQSRSQMSGFCEVGNHGLCRGRLGTERFPVSCACTCHQPKPAPVPEINPVCPTCGQPIRQEGVA